MIKLITHDDMDGIGCAIVGKLLLQEELDINYCNYNNVNEVVTNAVENHELYSKIYITDISVNEEVAELLETIKDKIILLDHHLTTTWLNKYDWATVCDYDEKEVKVSGIYMLYNLLTSKPILGLELINNSLSTFVRLVRLYDTWLWKEVNYKEPKQLNDLFLMMGRDEFINMVTNKIYLNDTNFIDATNTYLLKIRQMEINNYIDEKEKTLTPKTVRSYEVGVVFAEQFISEMGNVLSERHPEFDLIAMIDIGKNKISYRTVKDDVNVGEFATIYGGGGIKKASGSEFDTWINKCIIDELLH